MAATRDCPDPRSFQRLAHGRAAPDEVEAFACHLEGCSACAERLDGLGAFDDLAKAAGPSDEFRPDPQALDARIRQWEGLPEQARRANAATPKGRADVTAASSGQGEPAPSLPDNPRYQPVRLLAEGGLGEVFVARDAELHREVALKRVRPEYAADDECRRRFLREAEITGRLEHPGVVPVYGLVEDESGQPCYAMRLIEGESFQEAIKRYHGGVGGDAGERRLELRQLLGHFVAVCNAVAYAHSRGVVHRDLKPANVMLGKYGETVVVDWGLARSASRGPEERTAREETLRLARASAGATLPGEAMGTPAYMSPEQASGGEVGPAGDVYSLGATLYSLLTGQPPFAGDDPSLVLRDVRAGAFAPPRRVRPEVPAALEAVCLKAMARDRADRYASVKELAGDVERWLADEAVTAHAESWVRRLERWCRRRRTPVAVAATVLLALLAGAAAAVVLGDVSARRELELDHRRSQAELWEQQRAQARVDALRASAAEGAEQLARSELRAGNFEVALKLLRTAEDGIKAGEDPALAALRERIGERAARVGKVVQFYHFSNEAERAIAERFRDPDDPVAMTSSAKALGQLGVFDHPGEWWEHLPGADLTPAQQEQLRRDAYRELMLLALLQAKADGGLSKMGQKSAAPAYRRALKTLEMVQRHRRSLFGEVLTNACHFLLGDHDKIEPPTLREPTSSADAHFAGTLHVWVATQKDDPIVGIARGAQAFVDLGIDFKTPEVTAERHLRTALRLEPHHYWTNYWFGVAMLALQKYEIAETALTFCVVQRPEYKVGFGTRALAIQAQVERTKDPVRKKQLIEHGLAGLEEALRVNPGKAWPHAVLGVARRIAGEQLGQPAYFARAVEDLTRALEIDDTDPFSYEERGRAFRAQRRYASALADFEAAIKLDERDGTLLVQRARLALDVGDHERAIQDLGGAARRLPNAPEVFNLRGNAHWRRKEYALAREDYARALALHKGPLYHVNRAGCHLALGDLDQAIADVNEGLRLGFQGGEAYDRRGQAYLRKKQYDKALADLNEAVKRAPRAGSFAAARGDCQLRLGQVGAAVKDYQQALLNGAAADAVLPGLDEILGEEPGRADARHVRGVARLAARDFAKAADDLAQVQAGPHARPERLALYRGRAFLGLGEYGKAEAELAAAAAVVTEAEQRRSAAMGAAAVVLVPELWASADRDLARAALGRLDEAAAGLESAVREDPQYYDAWFRLAVVRTTQRDDQGYRRLCKALVEQFGKAPTPDEAALVVRACLLARAPGADPTLLVSLAEWAADRYPNRSATLASLGAAHLRAGQLPLAAQRLTAAVERAEPEALPRALYYRALVRHRLGQHAEAARDLDDAEKALAAAAGLAWDRRAELEPLRAEVKGEITPTSGGTP